ncbi:MAG TPA: hypothetical protein VIG33_03625 [Pseudobdellovibrionaceae bacterium]|jgi:hypothetical protein
MSENEKTESFRPKLEHVALSAASVQKINAWLEQASAKKKGVKISRKDFINWLIEKSPDNLSGSDLSALIDRFYDEAKFLRHLLREVNQAKAEGKPKTGFELVVKAKRTDTKQEVERIEASTLVLDTNDQ